MYESRQGTGPKSEKRKDTRSNRTMQKNKRSGRKMESNDSPEIPNTEGEGHQERPPSLRAHPDISLPQANI